MKKMNQKKMTARQKKLAAFTKPKNKITRGDVIAAAKLKAKAKTKVKAKAKRTRKK